MIFAGAELESLIPRKFDSHRESQLWIRLSDPDRVDSTWCEVLNLGLRFLWVLGCNCLILCLQIKEFFVCRFGGSGYETPAVAHPGGPCASENMIAVSLQVVSLSS